MRWAACGRPNTISRYAGTTTLAITPRALSVILGGSKVYDGQLGFANATFSLDNTVSGDTLGVTGTAQFVDKNAGTAKPVNLTGLALSGNDLGNYSLAETGQRHGRDQPRQPQPGQRERRQQNLRWQYQRQPQRDLEGVIGADQVQLSGASANFTDKNVGAGQGRQLQRGGQQPGRQRCGQLCAQYRQGKTSAGITARTLDLGFTGVNKTYDGGTAAAVTVTDNRVTGDVLTATASGAFADKNAGAARP